MELRARAAAGAALGPKAVVKVPQHPPLPFGEQERYKEGHKTMKIHIVGLGLCPSGLEATYTEHGSITIEKPKNRSNFELAPP